MGVKQNVLAEKVGVSNNYISNIEHGRSIPSLNVFVEICRGLNTTPDSILLGVGKTDDVPLRITENLKLCDDESLSLIEDYIQHILSRQNKKKN